MIRKWIQYSAKQVGLLRCHRLFNGISEVSLLLDWIRTNDSRRMKIL
uniref:Uncharacterized protein n=1 Tax=Picea glauca TaxID=3330 RepID=A0A101M527_PICGL|nr:hypothetical protein ABT39_MTgene935 [Picea glauca]